MSRFRHAGEADRRGEAEEWPRLRKPFMLAAKRIEPSRLLTTCQVLGSDTGEFILRVCISLVSGFLIPIDRLSIVFRQAAVPILVHQAKFV
jgi:hypothetical protein